jgi:hypothetical protein
LIITPTGRALLHRPFSLWQKTHAAIEQTLTAREPDRLHGALKMSS